MRPRTLSVWYTDMGIDLQLLDMDAFGKVVFDETLPKYGDGRPPSTLIGVTRLSNPEYLIEIDLMAVVDPAKESPV